MSARLKTRGDGSVAVFDTQDKALASFSADGSLTITEDGGRRTLAEVRPRSRGGPVRA